LWTPTSLPADLKDIPIKQYDLNNALKATIKNNVPIQNFRFNLAGPTAGTFEKAYIAVHSATIDTYTSMTLHFKLIKALPKSTGIKWGRIILTVPTMDDWYL
jgi:hypothetical protein